MLRITGMIMQRWQSALYPFVPPMFTMKLSDELLLLDLALIGKAKRTQLVVEAICIKMKTLMCKFL